MGSLCGFYDVAKGCLAPPRVVLFRSHTSTARSFVLASGFVSSRQLDPAQSQNVRFHSPLTASVHFQEVQLNEIHMRTAPGDEELIFPGLNTPSVWNGVTRQSLFNGRHFRDDEQIFPSPSKTHRPASLV